MEYEKFVPPAAALIPKADESDISKEIETAANSTEISNSSSSSNETNSTSSGEVAAIGQEVEAAVDKEAEAIVQETQAEFKKIDSEAKSTVADFTSFSWFAPKKKEPKALDKIIVG